MSIDSWLKRLWLTIGAVVLPLVLLLAGFLLWSWYSEHRNSQDRAVTVPPTTAAPHDSVRAVRYSLPETIRGSSTRLVRVYYGSGSYQNAAFYGSAASAFPRSDDGPPINVVFLDSAGSKARTLLSEAAYIRDISFPSEPRDSLQTWMTFEVVRKDTDGDGKLSFEDDPVLLIADLDGRNVRNPLPDRMRYQHSDAGPRPGSLLIYALEPIDPSIRHPKDEQLRQRAFLYDRATGTLQPYTVLEEAVLTAARALSTPAK